MKREIKFRVWDNVLNTYHYNWQAVIHGHLQAKSYGDVGFTAIEDPELTFEQFTGCLDKNGVEIYEGDIIENEYYRVELEDCADLPIDSEKEKLTVNLQVVQYETGFCLKAINHEVYYPMEGIFLTNSKVVGNVHNNLG